MEDKVKVWIARDKSGELFLSSERPNKMENYWGSEVYTEIFRLDSSLFSSVKWEDDEPTEAYITLAEPQSKPEKEIDWEQRGYEIAKELMYKIYRQEVAVSNRGQCIMLKDVADIAVAFADTLIKKLKEQSE